MSSKMHTKRFFVNPNDASLVRTMLQLNIAFNGKCNRTLNNYTLVCLLVLIKMLRIKFRIVPRNRLCISTELPISYESL